MPDVPSYGESASDRLAAVRAAIQRVLTSQEYSHGQHRQRMADLKALREMEKELIEEVNQGGRFAASVAVIVPPT